MFCFFFFFQEKRLQVLLLLKFNYSGQPLSLECQCIIRAGINHNLSAVGLASRLVVNIKTGWQMHINVFIEGYYPECFFKDRTRNHVYHTQKNVSPSH